MNDQEPIEQLSNELSQITQDFCENYDLTRGEFNKLMLLQILDSYANVGKQKEFLDSDQIKLLELIGDMFEMHYMYICVFVW